MSVEFKVQKEILEIHKIGANLLLDLFNDIGHLRNHDGVSRSRKRYGAIADFLDTLQLDEISFRRDKTASLHQNGVFARLFKGRLCQIQRSAGTGQARGVAFFIQRMSRDGERRAFSNGGKRHQFKAILTQDPEHTVAPASGRCGNGGTLQYFADMSRQTGIHSLFNSKTGKNSRVIGAPGDDDLSALFQSLDKGLRPHLSDNANGLIHIRSVNFRYGVQRMNLALSELRLDRLVLDLRADDGHFKMKPLLRGNLFDNIHIPV